MTTASSSLSAVRPMWTFWQRHYSGILNGSGLVSVAIGLSLGPVSHGIIGAIATTHTRYSYMITERRYVWNVRLCGLAARKHINGEESSAESCMTMTGKTPIRVSHEMFRYLPVSGEVSPTQLLKSFMLYVNDTALLQILGSAWIDLACQHAMVDVSSGQWERSTRLCGIPKLISYKGTAVSIVCAEHSSTQSPLASESGLIGYWEDSIVSPKE